jgi:hypothetical protein
VFVKYGQSEKRFFYNFSCLLIDREHTIALDDKVRAFGLIKQLDCPLQFPDNLPVLPVSQENPCCFASSASDHPELKYGVCYEGWKPPLLPSDLCMSSEFHEDPPFCSLIYRHYKTVVCQIRSHLKYFFNFYAVWSARILLILGTLFCYIFITF